MGFPENESRAALTAAMGNPDLAYEFLLTGIPQHAMRAPAPARAPANPAAQPAAPPAAGRAGPSAAEAAQLLQMLSTMPANQRAQIAQTMGLQPEQLEAAMQLMPADLGAGEGDDEEGGGVVTLNEEDMAAINRLVAMGFSQEQATEAYVACNGDEMVAANFLIEGGWPMEDGEGDFHDHGDDEY